jgi:probable HAF family extracellular repeat protein
LGGALRQATGINAAGEVVGYSLSPDGSYYPFLYTNGVMSAVSPTAIGQSIVGVNNSGQVVGLTYLFSNGTATTLSAETTSSSFRAKGINDSNQVIGDHTITPPTGIIIGGVTPTPSTHAVLMNLNPNGTPNGPLIDLGTLGGTNSYAFGVNNSGNVVGEAQTAGNTGWHAFVYSNGTMTDLFPGSSSSSIASAINNAGDITGINGAEAFLYSNGQVIDIGTVGGTGAVPRAISNTGTVVGEFDLPGGGFLDAFVYSNGVAMDLNSLIDPNSGWLLTSAMGVNDAGQIVGYGINASGHDHAFLLTPVPEPATISALLFAAPLLCRRRTKRKTI